MAFIDLFSFTNISTFKLASNVDSFDSLKSEEVFKEVFSFEGYSTISLPASILPTLDSLLDGEKFRAKIKTKIRNKIEIAARKIARGFPII
ncbi:MAG: hypothetical protein H0Z28_09145 [Archaeoglobus sp.]|nr:hypothetical protein [Archaeoglobus sp.]